VLQKNEKGADNCTILYKSALFLVNGFSQLSAAEFFVFRKMEACKTKKHLLLK